MKNFKNTFWLVAGCFEILFSFVGVQAIAASPDVMAKTLNDDSVSESQMPVRIPRPLLQRTLWGNLKIQFTDATLNLDLYSPVYWVQEATTLPQPLAGAQADYRDFRGCLSYQDLDGVAVCFNVMPDVSSVGVNSREMQLQGIEDFMTQQLSQLKQLSDCVYRTPHLQLVQASREDTTVTMDFSGEAVPQPGCKQARQPLLIRVQLQAA